MTRSTASPTPHSWDLEHWPQHVFPHTPNRARYIVRSHRNELLRAGAISRVGRELVIVGARYARWLEQRASHVAGYECAANRNRGEGAPDRSPD